MKLQILYNSDKSKGILLSTKDLNASGKGSDDTRILFKNSTDGTKASSLNEQCNSMHDGYIEVKGFKSFPDPIKSIKNIKMVLYSNNIREIYTDPKYNYIIIKTIHGYRYLNFNDNVIGSKQIIYAHRINVKNLIRLNKIKFDVVNNDIKKIHIYNLSDKCMSITLK